MKKKSTRKFSKIIIGVAIIVVIFVTLVTRKLLLLSADPMDEKDCPPLLANAAQLPTPIKVQIALPWLQHGGTINDASCLDRTPVYGIVTVKSESDIKNALHFAKENNLKVSAAGVRHSMGGQAFSPNSVVLNMLSFNKMSLDEPRKMLTVQGGATWHDIQSFLHPRFAVKAMQSTDIFTVGGSISVNAHGMDHHAGSVANTIRFMRVMLPDGSIQTLSRTQNPGLFHLVIGGYGLFGVILDAQLEVTENVVYERGRNIIDYKNFPEQFANQILPDEKLGLFYGHLSTAPGSFLKEMMLYTYEQTDAAHSEIPPLGDVENVKLRRLVLNLSKGGPIAKGLKWFSEKYIEPKLEGCSVNRNQAMKEGESCLVSRNEPMHDSVKYLKNNLPGETDILQEYFIPRDKFIPFVDSMREILTKNDANLLNASVRVVHKEDNFLTYAPKEMFAIVLYLNQKVDAKGNESMATITKQMIDLTASLGGRFFLPYQLYYSPQQLEQSYPEIRSFFAAKKHYDPQEIFTNTFYQTYAKSLAQ